MGSLQVEAVADAYMVISGAPTPLRSHAERLANAALGLLFTAQELTTKHVHEDGDSRPKVSRMLPPVPRNLNPADPGRDPLRTSGVRRR
jgi:hypothetical protein